MKARLIGLVIALQVVLFMLAGCDSPVDDIRNSKLAGREQTTVGDAFDAAIQDAKWELIVTANKSRVVQVSGITKRTDPILQRGVRVLVQFMLKDDQFETSYAELEKYQVNFVTGGGGAANVALNRAQIESLLDFIYAN